MAIVLQTANENPDVENVQENTIQRNAIAQHFNAHSARIHMKHGDMSALPGSLRNIDLKNYGIDALISSLFNIKLRLMKYLNIE